MSLFDWSFGSCRSLTKRPPSEKIVMQRHSAAPASKSEGGASVRSSGLRNCSMLSFQQTPRHFGKDLRCLRPHHSSKADYNGFHGKAEPVPSTCDGSGSEPPNSNKTHSLARSHRNGHFNRFGVTQVSAESSVRNAFAEEMMPSQKVDLDRIQSQMNTFVKRMVRGRELNALSVDGQLRNCTCSLDRKLRNYTLVINKEIRSIPLSKIKEVFQGAEPDDIATPLDELCATIMLDTGECLSFRFGDVRERETFSLCLQIVVDGKP